MPWIDLKGDDGIIYRTQVCNIVGYRAGIEEKCLADGKPHPLSLGVWIQFAYSHVPMHFHISFLDLKEQIRRVENGEDQNR